MCTLYPQTISQYRLDRSPSSVLSSYSQPPPDRSRSNSPVSVAIQDARAWKAAQTHVKMPSLPPRSVVPLFTVPAANTYTWSSFSDAAWDSSTGNCGMGWQLRDSMDVCADQGSSHRRFVPSALVAEALAVKAAMTAALLSHVCSLVVYSDSKSLIKLLNTQGLDVA
ncbi:hypothetical protein F2Q68_00031707 [Brassica cretica]|uniref:RNase H type-1 domain-containing protein n=1 Tax=Brassica cretica TaxID=69181 RepID=A0A8S9G9T5_BRACR|nr:hypothetical protein F2Q68_00031707 [Brassica cretica]